MVVFSLVSAMKLVALEWEVQQHSSPWDKSHHSKSEMGSSEVTPSSLMVVDLDDIFRFTFNFTSSMGPTDKGQKYQKNK